MHAKATQGGGWLSLIVYEHMEGVSVDPPHTLLSPCLRVCFFSM